MDLRHFGLFVLLQVAAAVNKREKCFLLYSPLNDKIITGDVISFSSQRLPTACGTLCSYLNNCESFFFNSLTGECRIYDTLFATPVGASYRKGSKYYTIYQGTADWCPNKKGFKLLAENGPCVLFHTELVSWYEANRTCGSHSPRSRLVVLDNHQRNELVKSAGISINHLFKNAVWIGLSEVTKGTYRWVNGHNSVFTDWSSIDFSGLTSDDCAAMVRSDSWTWERRPCTYLGHYICEITMEICNT